MILFKEWLSASREGSGEEALCNEKRPDRILAVRNNYRVAVPTVYSYLVWKPDPEKKTK